MKKNIVCLGLAAIMSLGSVPVIGSDLGSDGAWQQGWTGKEGSTDYTYTVEGNNVTITNTKANNGKFSDGEDSIIYYAQALDSDDDFTLSATISVDEYSTMEESSNPQQNSVGLAVIDELFNKTDDVAYTDGVFLGSYAESKTADAAFCPITRSNSETKTIGTPLSDTFANTGSDLGEFDLSIQKVGNTYTLTCGENSAVFEMNALEDEIYPCLYIARNVSATFSNVNLVVEDKKPVSLEVSGDYKDTYYYGESLDLSGLKAVVTYDDGSVEEIDDYLAKGFKSTSLGKQTLTISKGNAKAQIQVNVKNKAVTEINVTYPPVQNTYYINSVLDLTGLEAEAVYEDGTSEILQDGQYTVKINNKTYNDGDVLSNLTGEKTVCVYRANEKGISVGNAVGRFNINIENKTLDSLEITPPVKTVYYLGDEIDLSGLKVTGVYKEGEKTAERLLSSKDYVVTGFDSQTAGEKTITVQTAAGEGSASFTVEVKERQAEKIEITKYPRTTYGIGEEFDGSDMQVSIVYDNGDVERTEQYTVDTSAFNTSAQGESIVKIIPENSSLASVELKVVCKEQTENKWRTSVFGQSSGYDKISEGNAGATADEYGTINGKINVRSWDGSGKITNDHDGMSYYYTTVNAEDNFKIVADITVNKYLEHDNDDTKRNGQEAFGIMARDVVPLQDAQGSLTTDESLAAVDDEGVALPLPGSSVFASNIVLVGGYSGTGYDKDPNADRINLLVRSGVEAIDGGGSRTAQAISVDYPQEGHKYKITLEKINGGFYSSCYDYTNDTTMEAYYYDDSILGVQSDKAYVGFFTARWADIDVENAEFYVTDKAYDQTVSAETDKTKTADLDITSSKYATDTDYNVVVAPENSTGTVTVKVNNKIVAENAELKGSTVFEAVLNKNSVNRVTVVYTPDDTLDLVDYSPIVKKMNVYHKDYDKNAAEIYASVDGTFDGDGTSENPFDVDTAIGLLQPGQTLVLKEGTYYRTTPIEIEHGNDGKTGAYKTVKAEEGKTVVFDYENTSAGVVLSGDYWKFDGIEFTNCGDNQKCFHLGGSYCVIENCKFYNNRDMGLQISRTDSDENRANWPSYNSILNCEAYNNCDPSMINADGFGAKLTVGEGNIFKDCVSHHNVDDGWDLYTKTGSGAIGAVTLENCVSYKNGTRLNDDGTETSYEAGGNNGFKLGGENVAVAHNIINCVAYSNGNNGLTTNSNPALNIENCVSYNNKGANFRLYSDKPEEYAYTVKGAVSYNGGEADVIGSLNENPEYGNNSETPLSSEINYFDLDGNGAVNSLGQKVTEDMLK